MALIAYEVLQVVEKCHELGILHGDVKPANFVLANRTKNPLFSKDINLLFGKPWLLAIDFGCSQYLGHTRFNKRTGTPGALACWAGRTLVNMAVGASTGCMLSVLFGVHADHACLTRLVICHVIPRFERCHLIILCCCLCPCLSCLSMPPPVSRPVLQPPRPRVLQPPWPCFLQAVYMAPEIFDRDYHWEADMWSLGIMLYQLYARRFPYWKTYEECRCA